MEVINKTTSLLSAFNIAGHSVVPNVIISENSLLRFT